MSAIQPESTGSYPVKRFAERGVVKEAKSMGNIIGGYADRGVVKEAISMGNSVGGYAERGVENEAMSIISNGSKSIVEAGSGASEFSYSVVLRVGYNWLAGLGTCSADSISILYGILGRITNHGLPESYSAQWHPED